MSVEVLEFAENVRNKILDLKLPGEVELDERTAALKCHLGDPKTPVLSSIFVQAWCRTLEP